MTTIERDRSNCVCVATFGALSVRDNVVHLFFDSARGFSVTRHDAWHRSQLVCDSAREFRETRYTIRPYGKRYALLAKAL
jgi:hypothetical protein